MLPNRMLPNRMYVFQKCSEGETPGPPFAIGAGTQNLTAPLQNHSCAHGHGCPSQPQQYEVIDSVLTIGQPAIYNLDKAVWPVLL